MTIGSNIQRVNIQNFPETKLIDLSQSMNFAENTTPRLWQSFMPRMKEITGTIGTGLFSVQQYNEGFFTNFNPDAVFTKWAAVSVDDFSFVPASMQMLTIPVGKYAVFHYKGSPADGAVFRYIFSEWLPQSGYQLDNRPHFEILGDKYKNGAGDSEEDIYIPIRP